MSLAYKPLDTGAPPRSSPSTSGISLHETPAHCKEMAVVEARRGLQEAATWPSPTAKEPHESETLRQAAFPCRWGSPRWRRFDKRHFPAAGAPHAGPNVSKLS